MLVNEDTLRVDGLKFTDAGQTRARRVTWHVCSSIVANLHPCMWQPNVEKKLCALFANLSNLSCANFYLYVIRELIIMCIARYATPYL